ncbi:hypothetical protein JHK82_026805 [Glycine max]|nr:hypothetical protein JHK87_026684 [Glycine soja]KAG4995991.1 hypothetical protein JHK85_027430 [Glycine max]KAG5002790.1 hypothetical protein JHK86_026929 [Glycine max]KAG5125970.1 hypothetical protein JHK82_026805 [Glycine max]KAG5150563.1 hypothetical protein JHK84_027035 [Glycine max]
MSTWCWTTSGFLCYYILMQHEPLNELPLLTKEHSSRKQFMVSIPISQQPSSKRLHLHRCSPALQLSYVGVMFDPFDQQLHRRQPCGRGLVTLVGQHRPNE